MTTLTVKVWADDNGNIFRTEIPEAELYKRPWVGLTDEEIKDALVSVDAEAKRLPPGFKDFAKAIESKLKEKNT